MPLSLPNYLLPEDTIGIVSTSSPTSKSAIEKMSHYFGERGYRVKVSQNVLAHFGFMAGNPEIRADDFNTMVQDSSIKMIMTANGGKSAAHLLPLIDYDLLRANPKIIVGLSDPSIILNSIAYKSKVPTFHGPNGYNFGNTGISAFSEENFWRIICGKFSVPYTFPIKDSMKVLRDGNAEGKLFGGHMGTNQALIGTPWEPQWEDTILFIEEIFVELNRIDAMLAHLRLSGVLKKIKGLIVGQLVGCEEQSFPKEETLEEILLRNCKEYDFPIAINVPVGHTDDKVTLPLGVKFKLDTANKSFQLLEFPFVDVSKEI